MKTSIRQFLTDLKAAAQIAHPESLQSALNGLQALPNVAGNHTLPESFLAQVVLPAAEILAARQIPANFLLQNQREPLTAVRAVCAAALGIHFLRYQDATHKDLQNFGTDPRPEVRAALAEALAREGAAFPKGLLALCVHWFNQPQPKLRQTALRAAEGLAQTHADYLLELLSAMEIGTDPDVRAALAGLLLALAQQGRAQPVLALLTTWAARPIPEAWIISQVLSGSWAAAHPREVESILKTLEDRTGTTSLITNVRRAMQRHTLTETP
ncbi:MAG: hypothetical protein OHK0052_16970 [Anaerolineales bacterium]